MSDCYYLGLLFRVFRIIRVITAQVANAQWATPDAMARKLIFCSRGKFATLSLVKSTVSTGMGSERRRCSQDEKRKPYCFVKTRYKHIQIYIHIFLIITRERHKVMCLHHNLPSNKANIPTYLIKWVKNHECIAPSICTWIDRYMCMYIYIYIYT